jgi:2,3-bisphosphoglycerate-dependent phosphoglycerate mutase
MAGKLILARHQESEWNKVGKWTGLQDRHLTEDGFINSEHMGILIKDLHIDQAYTSMLVRSIETLSCMMNVCERVDVPIEHAAALNERDYGDYTGKNKYEMQALLGDDEFKRLRRSWDYPIPHGESLKMVYERTVPFFTGTIVPKVMAGQNVLIVAHGNSLRSLVKYIENISDEGIADVEFPFGMIIVYDIDDHGKMLRKEVRESNPVGTPRGRTKIVATIGPASANHDALTKMIQNHMDIARLNFSWGSLEEHAAFISLIRSVAAEQQTTIPVMIDLPGPAAACGRCGISFPDRALSRPTAPLPARRTVPRLLSTPRNQEGMGWRGCGRRCPAANPR